MKKLIAVLSLVFCSVIVMAQSIEFLGIPIDGSKEKMEARLKEKGFKDHFPPIYLEGIFNGENVDVFISTNHGIVDRVEIHYPFAVERITRVKYNTLISRFSRNQKYIELRENSVIPDDENIQLEILSHDKVYDAVFFLLRSDIASNSWKEDFYREYEARYSKPLSDLTQEEIEEVLFCLPSRIASAVSGVVWFTIRNKGRIVLYYDNLHNRPHGEDL